MWYSFCIEAQSLIHTTIVVYHAMLVSNMINLKFQLMYLGSFYSIDFRTDQNICFIFASYYIIYLLHRMVNFIFFFCIKKTLNTFNPQNYFGELALYIAVGKIL